MRGPWYRGTHLKCQLFFPISLSGAGSGFRNCSRGTRVSAEDTQSLLGTWLVRFTEQDKITYALRFWKEKGGTSHRSAMGRDQLVLCNEVDSGCWNSALDDVVFRCWWGLPCSWIGRHLVGSCLTPVGHVACTAQRCPIESREPNAGRGQSRTGAPSHSGTKWPIVVTIPFFVSHPGFIIVSEELPLLLARQAVEVSVRAGAWRLGNISWATGIRAGLGPRNNNHSQQPK